MQTCAQPSVEILMFLNGLDWLEGIQHCPLYAQNVYFQENVHNKSAALGLAGRLPVALATCKNALYCLTT